MGIDGFSNKQSVHQKRLQLFLPEALEEMLSFSCNIFVAYIRKIPYKEHLI